MSEERWKPIPGYGGWYDVSDRGRVRSWKKRGNVGVRVKIPKILKPRIHHKGYVKVVLYIAGKPRNHFVHGLVALVFIGVCPEGLEVDHVNDCRADNQRTNLRYLTAVENSRRGVWKIRGERNSNALFKDADIPVIRERFAIGETVKVIAEDYSVAETAISYVVGGYGWKHIKAVPRPLNIQQRARRSGKAKLKEVDIPVIRERRTKGDSVRSIAYDYSVSSNTIQSVVCGKTWKDVE